MENNNTKLAVRGIEVAKSCRAAEEPKITHGVYEFINLSEKAQDIYIENVRCIINDLSIPINDFNIYRLPDYMEIDKKNFTVASGATVQAEITFPFVDIPGGIFNEIFVEVSLKYGSTQWIAKSPYLVYVRTPRRQ